MRTLETYNLPVETCDSCGNSQANGFETIDFFSEGEAEQGDKHMEFLKCDNCGTIGCLQFTPPTDYFKLKGPLYGEPEEIDTLYEIAQSLN